ncbi:hypothetical protein BN2475_750008 [Paraburkholderia ribeironis]|uniref:Uncharacterized protein n=1 Tax=Paraburkholderia ribeironis TaxID=1247936 RepID=A0A1N7SJA4_9BURK|nr:hypothetical protein BN2475_750008 [Paraburkholderia ribeironis]
MHACLRRCMRKGLSPLDRNTQYSQLFPAKLSLMGKNSTRHYIQLRAFCAVHANGGEAVEQHKTAGFIVSHRVPMCIG